MTKDEREFLNDVKDALEDYEFSYEHYHDDDGMFCVDVEIELNDWGENADEIWDALEEVIDDWGGNMDSDMNTYYLGVDFDDD